MYCSIHNLAHKHRFLLLLFGLTILLILAWPHSTLAATTAPTVNQQNVYEVINTKLGILLQFLSVITWPILFMIGGLLDSSLIFGGDMEERLLQIWTFIRNFVNIIFVLILLVIAFYNILGRTEGEYSLKQVLPKFVITLIAINFSFLICRTVVDATNVLTSAVASLPTTLLTEESANLNKTAIKNICTKTDKKTNKPLMTAICSSTNELNEFGQKFFHSLDEKNISFVMAMVSISSFDLVDQKVDDLASFLINLAGNTLIFLLFSISYVVLFLVLLARVVVLWTMTALSPLIGLMIMLPEGVKSELSGDTDLKKIFIQHAIAPIAIVAALSIGFIMNRTLHGAPVPALIGLKLTDIHPEFKIGDIANLQELIILIATVAIIWTGVMGAASKTMAHYLTDSIKEFGERIGKFVGTSARYLPWIPVDVDKGTGQPSDFHSVGEFGMALDALESSFQQKARERIQPLIERFGGDPTSSSRRGFLNAVNSGQKETAQKEFVQYLKQGGDLSSLEIKQGLQAGKSKGLFDLDTKTMAVINNGTSDDIAKALQKDGNINHVIGSSENANKVFTDWNKAKQKTTDEDKADEKNKEDEENLAKQIKNAATKTDGGLELTNLVIGSEISSRTALENLGKDKTLPASMQSTIADLTTNYGEIHELNKTVTNLKTNKNLTLKPTDYLEYKADPSTGVRAAANGIDIGATQQKLVRLEATSDMVDDLEKATKGAASQEEKDNIIAQALIRTTGEGRKDFIDLITTGQTGAVPKKSIQPELNAWVTRHQTDLDLAKTVALVENGGPQKETHEETFKTQMQTRLNPVFTGGLTGDDLKKAIDDDVAKFTNTQLTTNPGLVNETKDELRWRHIEAPQQIKNKLATATANPTKRADLIEDLGKEFNSKTFNGKTYKGGKAGKTATLNYVLQQLAAGPERAFGQEVINWINTQP